MIDLKELKVVYVPEMIFQKDSSQGNILLVIKLYMLYVPFLSSFYLNVEMKTVLT